MPECQVFNQYQRTQHTQSSVEREASTIQVPERSPRTFLPDQLVIDSWERLRQYFEDLKDRDIRSVEELVLWLRDKSELESVLEEDLAMRYIRMNIDTRDEEHRKAFDFFVSEIEPRIAPYANEFDKKFLATPFLDELDSDRYNITVRKVRKNIEIYREENIALLMELQRDSHIYGTVAAEMTVIIDEEEMTMQKAGTFLKSLDREKREDVFRCMHTRRAQDVDRLNELYSTLIATRDKVAHNAGFGNYRDYMFASLGRFDYSVDDCYDFHESIRTEIKPIVNHFFEQRKQMLDVPTLRPWDTQVDVLGKAALKPFEGGKELVAKTIELLHEIRPYFADCLEVMNTMGHLDLESKPGKAPGGFNYPLYEIGVPFIYMNAVGSLRDLVTMVHEGGHAIHSFLSRDLELTDFKNLPSEVAELASMSLELISMEHWHTIFENEDDLKRAKREQLETIICVLPWIAKVDAFQHWVYENPTHAVDERLAKWEEINARFGNDVVEWDGLMEVRNVSWQKQLHLFEVPFYYIEYGMAQLGAIAVWRNYKNDPERALDQYTEALSLGYTKSIGEIYETAGIKFDFSREYVRELAQFVREEIDKL